MNQSRPSFFDRHLYLLVHLKRLFTGGFYKTHYGQWGEDIVLSDLFANEKEGFYVDVGAYHPFHYSNTYLLYKKGWRGLNIDPNPSAIALFNFHRRRDTNINSGVGLEVARRAYYVFNHQSCNTFSVEQRDRMLQKSYIRQIKEVEVSSAPLQSLLDKYAPGKIVDLLNVDVEGMGLEVLRSLEWSRTTPRAICIEDDEYSAERPSEIHSFLLTKGYLFHARRGASSIFIQP